MFASIIRPRLILVAAALLLTATPALAFTVPTNDGFVTDMVDNFDTGLTPVFTREQKEALNARLLEYSRQTTNEIAVVVVSTLAGESAVDAAVAIGREWGVGTKENDNGIVFLVAYDDREVFIAPGYGLEGALPDIVVKGIIDEEIVPLFRDGRYAEGIEAGIDAMQKHIAGEYTADRYESAEGGFSPFIIVFIFVMFDALAIWMGRTKTWWLGGVLGGVTGIVLVVMFSWWISIPLLVALGLFTDFLLSRMEYGRHRRRRRRGGGFGGGGFGGGSGGGGGFGGFSGGSFGGGGAGGKW